MRIATFNVQNLRLRHPGGGDRLDGARDGDMPEDATDAAAALDPIDRELTAAVLKLANADVVALQEVFDAATLDYFHDRVLVPAGASPYPHRFCPPGNDGRGLDVAVMSRPAPVSAVSHAAETPETLGLPPVRGCGLHDRVFRRDCLEVDLGALTLFVCHFKAPYPDPAAAWPVRHLEARAVARLIERRFPDPAAGLWLVIGDLNEPAREDRRLGRAVMPLLEGFGIDLTQRLPPEERWSFHLPHTGVYSKPDAIIASPALAARFADAVPIILRAGLDREASRYAGPRLPGVGAHRPHASDHAAVVIDLPGL
ncbi:MAG: endonuclease/exonuclease/phosphatase family protein [Alphaproteobacteria bacterium]|nr:endonuclease/exonuclease/phosphatase family protein [Alphaproteobacteria bacterium]MCB9930053.1 endonuclease/exonuclease/phosphatase family protein [Alphaproteobacteria bacterium]